MDKIDAFVIEAVEEQIFTPQRLTAILQAITDRGDETHQQLKPKSTANVPL